MMTEKEASNLFVRLLSGSPRPLKGSELSILAKTSALDFAPVKFGCRNLREFIRRYAADEITEVGKAGMDVVYAIRIAEQQPLFESSSVVESAKPAESRGPLGQLLSNPRIWKTFASPSSPFRLFLVPSDGTIRVLRPGYSPDPTWLEVPRISADRLLQIAKDFIAELPGSQQASLLSLLDKPSWWLEFFDWVRTLGLKTRWTLFRRRRIAEEFERAVPALPAVATTAPQPVPVSEITPSVQSLSPAGAQSEMKRIAAEVVHRMTDSELRALNLPLGYVMDVLTTR
jgi:hypothetical protein